MTTLAQTRGGVKQHYGTRLGVTLPPQAIEVLVQLRLVKRKIWEGKPFKRKVCRYCGTRLHRGINTDRSEQALRSRECNTCQASRKAKRNGYQFAVSKKVKARLYKREYRARKKAETQSLKRSKR